MGRLTEPRLQELLHTGKPAVIAVGDGTGLSFRITKTDSKVTASWQLRYRHAGKARWSTLGRYPELSLKEAKRKATKERAVIGEGVDPVAERRRSKMALKAAKTFRELTEDYMVRAVPDLAKSTQRDVRGFLKNDILPRLGDLRIEEITGAEIVHMVEQIGKRSAVVARRAFTITSVIFSHGIAKHLAQSNPCASLKLRAILGKQQPVFKTVSLTEEQLRAVLPRLPEVGRANALAVKVLLATCTRKGELVRAGWEHLDLEQRLWNIPAKLSKNGKPFTIPLPEVVVGWFRDLRQLARGSEWVLPGQNRKGPMGDSALNGALYRLDGSLPRFTVHDLRRTARSHLGALGVDVIVAEKCLNHTLGGLVEVYDRGAYLPQRRRALELWASFLVCCEEGRPWKVEPLRVVA